MTVENLTDQTSYLTRLERSRWLGLLPFAGTVLVVLAFWVLRPPGYLGAEAGDTAALLRGDYSLQTLDLLAGRGLIYFRYPPLFPLWLAGAVSLADALAVNPALLLAAINLVLTALIVTLVYALTSHLWRPLAGLVAAAALATYIPFLWTTTYLASETPYMTALVAAVYLLMRALTDQPRNLWLYAACGLLSGVAMLTRSVAVAVPLIFALVVLLRARALTVTRRALSAGVLLLAAVVVILPWQVAMTRALGEFALLSTGGVPSILDGLSFAVDPSEARPIDVPPPVEQLQRDIYEQQYDELNSVGTISTYLLGELGTRPGAVVHLFGIKALRSWYGTNTGTIDGVTRWLQLGYVVVLGVGTVRAWQRSAASRSLVLVTLLLVLYAWVAATLVLSIMRLSLIHI